MQADDIEDDLRQAVQVYRTRGPPLYIDESLRGLERGSGSSRPGTLSNGGV
jgi:hypothetical protein